MGGGLQVRSETGYRSVSQSVVQFCSLNGAPCYGALLCLLLFNTAWPAGPTTGCGDDDIDHNL